ncbi:hypothetical protein BGP77_16875 [Saccharospirillum sp. MSK14-1]|uniref:GspH/FimT family protein n=1 Tax=Saccharospirillum sp. MSK14-1 TaxID=1897632 RepID=UPI000D467EE5|nr:GspH/FimT family protein [Saccharospirillum sp. MSK14-1]PTY38121.1 hypothetical protein BGP77_16875 [Saccharospirillum sp. MSK14-1]
MHTAKGLTLIELLLSLALLGILSALALPSYRQLIQTQSADRLRDDLFADLSFARSQALSLGLPVAVCTSTNLFITDPSSLTCLNPGTDWSAGWMIFIDVNNDKNHQSNEPLLSVYEDSPGDVLIRFNRTQAITFDRRGRANAASFYLCRQDIEYVQRIAVSLQGRIRYAAIEDDCE